MSAETAGHRFLGDDLKKSAIITFCFYIIAFVLFSALVFGTTLRLVKRSLNGPTKRSLIGPTSPAPRGAGEVGM